MFNFWMVSITLGATTSFLAEVRMFDTNQQKHVLRTALRGIQVEYEGFLPKGSTVVAIIDVKVVNAGSTPQVKAEASSQVIPRPYMHRQQLLRVIELCSGMGCMGFGLEHAGFCTVLKCDINCSMLQMSQRIHPAPTCQGDVTNLSLLAPMCAEGIDAGSIAAGVACQPYSRLGDQKAEQDSRSQNAPWNPQIRFFGSIWPHNLGMCWRSIDLPMGSESVATVLPDDWIYHFTRAVAPPPCLASTKNAVVVCP